jgi:ribosomal-protein-alanine N-acetyltransferase
MKVAIEKADHNENTEPVICGLSKASLQDILRIEILSDAPAWNEKLFQEEFVNEHAHFFGARINGILAGFLLCHCINDEAHILKFGVLPEHRAKGVGRSLISYVIRDLHANAAKWVTLEVRRSNSVAKNLYESLGFSEVGIREGYYSDNKEDALILSLSISHFLDIYGEHPVPKSNDREKQKAFHLF